MTRQELKLLSGRWPTRRPRLAPMAAGGAFKGRCSRHLARAAPPSPSRRPIGPSWAARPVGHHSPRRALRQNGAVSRRGEALTCSLLCEFTCFPWSAETAVQPSAARTVVKRTDKQEITEVAPSSPRNSVCLSCNPPAPSLGDDLARTCD